MNAAIPDWVVVMVDVTFVAVSGVRVGTGSAGAGTATDAPIFRYPSGAVVLPGSSLKGVLRSGAESLLRAIDPRLACDITSDTDRCFAQSKQLPASGANSLCWPCRLFGNPLWAARLTIEDFLANDATTFVRDGVAIDRAELKAADHKKYDYEVVAQGTTFTGRLRLDDPAPEDIGFVDTLLALVDNGILTVGGGRSRGLGRLRLSHPPRWRTLSAVAVARGTMSPQDVDLVSARQALADRLSTFQ